MSEEPKNNSSENEGKSQPKKDPPPNHVPPPTQGKHASYDHSESKPRTEKRSREDC